MKRSHLALLAGSGLVLAACATSPTRVYGPGPSQTGAAASTVSLEGKIAECGHSGAAPAQVVYPDGWQTRFNEVAQKSMSNDELLGGPVTTEVVARNDKPVRPPVPSYPASAASRGVEGLCYALMDVTPAGTPDEILTACSSPAFSSATYEAVRDLEFAPKTVEGRQVRRLNVVYPVQYCLQD
ncbi:energy transducer TonB [Henriciella sp.]|uniref:energy transducer TonB n=1 Tax=Henriciella sp. TaxID=1968823 RepID=UPI0026234ACF|nr:energy transducer TonB [Henriciella sp.]